MRGGCGEVDRVVVDLFWVGLFGGCLVNMWMVWIDCLDNCRVRL